MVCFTQINPRQLIKTSALHYPPAPVKKTQETDFAYSKPTPTIVVQQQAPVIQKEITKVAHPKQQKHSVVGKKNSTKSIKVPTVVHSEINLSGSFKDENKKYAILQKLVDRYRNEHTDCQQRQFEFMVEAFIKEEN